MQRTTGSTCKQLSILETTFVKRVQALSLRFFCFVKETVQYQQHQQSHYRKQVKVFFLNSSPKAQYRT